jgi:hypothetical protein
VNDELERILKKAVVACTAAFLASWTGGVAKNFSHDRPRECRELKQGLPDSEACVMAVGRCLGC